MVSQSFIKSLSYFHLKLEIFCIFVFIKTEKFFLNCYKILTITIDIH